MVLRNTLNQREVQVNRVTIRPEVLGGKPFIRDVRISVELFLSL